LTALAAIGGENAQVPDGFRWSFVFSASMNRKRAASAITGIVFPTSVSESGVHLIALIMIGVSIVAVALSVLDRKLRSPGRPTSQP
jgi:hypothetical protein